MMNDSKDMLKIKKSYWRKKYKKYDGSKKLLAPPIYYNEIMEDVTKGKLVTTTQIRNYLAKQD